MSYAYDLIIVGAGPAGIFTALELLRKSARPQELKILLIEKGKPVERRHCPKAETGHCVNCKPTCAITTGFSGAGAFSDGKLSLSREVGGELPELIGEEFAQDLIDYTDKIYLEFGADPHVEGVYEGAEIKEIRMSPGIDIGDFNTKLKNAQKFIADGNRVKVSVRFRGREMAHTDIGRDLLDRFAAQCAETANLDKPAKLEGRMMSIFLSPKSGK